MDRRSTVRRAVAALAVVVALAAAVPAGAAVRWFHSPSGNIGCEVGWKRAGVGTYAYCQTGAPPRSVRMNARGTYRVCNGQTCLGNPPQGVPALPYGRSIRVGGFRCSSARAGITCIVISSGRGFRISREGVRRVG